MADPRGRGGACGRAAARGARRALAAAAAAWAAVGTAALAAPAAAQAVSQQQVVVEAIYDRAVHAGGYAWGGGAEYQLTWGGARAPVQLGTAVGLDAERQAGDGQRRLGLDADVTVQPGGGARLTPFAGAGAGAVWVRGEGESGRPRLGLDGIVGAQLTVDRRGTAVQAELRHGYVRGQPHSTSARVGVAISL
jgi:hypothetical protein